MKQGSLEILLDVFHRKAPEDIVKTSKVSQLRTLSYALAHLLSVKTIGFLKQLR